MSSVLTHMSRGGRRVYLPKAVTARFLSSPLFTHISTCKHSQQRKPRESNFQFLTSTFKQQSAKLKNLGDQKSHSDILPFTPSSLLVGLGTASVASPRSSQTNSRSQLLRTANSPISKHGKYRGKAQHFPSHEKSLLPL